MRTTVTGLPESVTLSDVTSILGDFGDLTSEMPKPGTVVISGPALASVQKAASVLIGTYPGAQISG